MTFEIDFTNPKHKFNRKGILKIIGVLNSRTDFNFGESEITFAFNQGIPKKLKDYFKRNPDQSILYNIYPEDLKFECNGNCEFEFLNLETEDSILVTCEFIYG